MDKALVAQNAAPAAPAENKTPALLGMLDYGSDSSSDS
jgi:hypothetical protein